MDVKKLLSENREILQLAYGITLIVFIPLLIAYNTISIIGKYNRSIDVSLQRQALTVGRSIYALIQDDLDDKGKLQEKINSLSKKNIEFQNLEVLAPKDTGFEIIASTDQENIGKILNFYYYQMAWIQPDNDGLATDSLRLAATDEGKELQKGLSQNERFWLVAMPVNDSSGKKQAILSIKISSKIIDDLTAENRDNSIYLLLITIVAVVLFLTITIRLWDYAILYRKIKEVDQMKDEFISMASHELRTPLGIIRGYASMILEGTFGKIENPEIKKSLDRIMDSTKRLEELVEDLLNVSRIEQGRLSIEIEKIEIEPIIEEIASQYKISADEKKLSLEYIKPSGKLPLVLADPERLKQVLINLIGNAIKYTEKGSVKITTELKNDKLEIKVADTGIGISSEEQKRLFEKFYRVKSEKTAKISGTGLGLWIVRQIIELMKGKIYIESMKGVGTQAIVVLNIVKK